VLLHGSEDRKIPPSHSAALHGAAPDHSRLIVVAGEGHDSIMTDRSGVLAGEGIALAPPVDPSGRRALIHAAPRKLWDARQKPGPAAPPSVFSTTAAEIRLLAQA
jgi:hypothetical protein